MIILQVLGLMIWLVVVPVCMGLLPAGFMQKQNRNVPMVVIAGYLLMFAVFEVIAVPTIVLCTYHGFTTLTRWFTGVSLVLAGAGLVCMGRVRKRDGFMDIRLRQGVRGVSLEEKIFWGLFFLLVGFQLYMAFTRASFDGDDAYYVVHSLAAQQLDTMYRNNPFLGRSAPLDFRHCMAAFPMWVAYVGRMSNIHSTIVSHSVIPLLALPLTYLVYYQAGRVLLRSRKDMLPVFMIVMALLQMFGNVSIYTNETFLMTRSWQGKSWTANFIIPLVICLFLWLFAKEQERRDHVLWVLLSLTNWSAGLFSSMAVFLCAILTGMIAFLLAVRERKFSVLVKGGLTCVPNGIYILVYLYLLYFY